MYKFSHLPADEVEELLIQELRRLGHTSMTQWAQQAEARVSDELTRQDPTLRSRKKKVLKWWCVFGEVSVRDRVWRSLTALCSPLAAAVGREDPRPVAAAATGADGLWLRTFLCPGGGPCSGTLWLGAGQHGRADDHLDPCAPGAEQRLRRGDVAKVLTALEGHLEPVGTAEEEAPVRNAYRYVSNRQDCLDYPRALGLGLPIGSGMIESGHRHVLQARLKKAGTAWLHDHADQIAHLRVLRANHQWEALWN